jgi:hypothetical protein
MSLFNNVLSQEDLAYLTALPQVTAAREKLNSYTSSYGQVYFSIPLTDSIRDALHARLGLDLSATSEIPMRWIKGDTAPHIDVGASQFENTYLMYVTDSPGELVLDDTPYPITQNTAFVFNEGISHKTQLTGATPRLLVGPMNEIAQPVGSPLAYFPTEADALAFTNALGYSGSFVVGSGGPFGPGGGYTYWRLASNSTGTSSQANVYSNGDTLNSDGGYSLYPAAPCFLEGTQVLCQVDGVEKYIPVESMRSGTLVKTSRDGYKKVVLIAKGDIHNPGTDERIENRLYKLSPSNYPDLKEELFITGCHSILEFPITEQQQKDTIKRLGSIFITDKKYRLMACVDSRAEPWNSEGKYTIWHFALENEDDGMNYGVYVNGGLLVETCAIRTLKNRSNMIVV